ncbi:MAG: hypothetical protein M3281_00145, partial [Chloroflexota bacterium]|nr:hypothetical protein [Chloroflexota bacterium]
MAVWVALKAPRTVTLRIYSPGAGGELVEELSGTRGTVRLGDHLHVAAVTARVDDGEPELSSDRLYSYNLFFTSEGAGPADVADPAPSLYTPGILFRERSAPSRLNQLVYPGHSLPSFVLPPEDPGRIRIVHGSCRKPHGAGREALSTADLILEQSADSPSERPHLLFLTGDQIYADDVAAPLLHHLTTIGDCLLEGNVHEVLPPDSITARELRPLRRGTRVRAAGFTTTTPASHLLSLAEFYAMYLLAWSDTLWPASFPTAAEIYSAEPLPSNRTEAAHDFIDAQGYGLVLQRLNEFRSKLPQVRRALANIPTYMIMDDHDVTDDWYLDGAWCKRVLESPLGRRVIRNALLAYALFQGWGNDPEQFDAPNGASFLAAVDSWRGDESDAALETIEQRLAISDSFSGAGELPVPEDALRWHYTLTAARYQVIVLNTRTRRTYPRPAVSPGLLSPTALEEQLAGAGRELTVIVSATPVIGVDLVEKLQFLTQMRSDNYEYDREGWSMERHTFQSFLHALSQMERVVILAGDVHYGFGSSVEYWDHISGRTAKIVNLTSSSLKNSADATQKAILTVGYPQFYRLLKRGEVPPLDYLAWDTFLGNSEVVHQALDALRHRWRRAWWALPILVELLRSPFTLVLPARGWPHGSFDSYPPDRSYRVRFLRDARQRSAPRVIFDAYDAQTYSGSEAPPQEGRASL